MGKREWRTAVLVKAKTFDGLFVFSDAAATEVYTLSLHDALPIFGPGRRLRPLRGRGRRRRGLGRHRPRRQDRKSTRLNSSHMSISYAVFCLKKKNAEHTELVTSIANQH